jgi:hypothetical protein
MRGLVAGAATQAVGPSAAMIVWSFPLTLGRFAMIA